MPNEKNHTMTAEEARSFDGHSQANALFIAAHLKCDCQPYEDVFTFNRWKAQGLVVRKGQHGIKIPVIVQGEVKEEQNGEEVKTRRSFKRATTVFCRCQVQPIQVKESKTA